MNDAISWALEQSKSKGAVRTVLMAISRRARGCRAECSPGEIMRFLSLSKSTYGWAVSELRKLGEVEMRIARYGKLNGASYHLQGFCHSADNIGKSCYWTSLDRVDSGKLSSATATITSVESSDPISSGPVENSSSGKLQRSFLFPDILTKEQAREVCEECRGTGWRTVKYLNSHGDEVEGAAPCNHAIVRVAGRWSFKQQMMQERFLNEQITQAIKALARPSFGPIKVPTQLKLKMVG